MHESSLCNGLMRRALAVAADHQARVIRRVSVSLGPLCGITAGDLRAAFDHCAEGTIAAQATLEIHETPLVAYCPLCEAESDVAPDDLSCPRCGTAARLVGGHELVLEHVDLGL